MPKNMYRIAFFFLIIFSGVWIGRSADSNQQGQTRSTTATPSAADSTSANPCDEFNRVNTAVLLGQIEPVKARAAIRELVPRLEAYFQKHGGVSFPQADWVFPVQGYTPAAIGGNNGSGYVVGRFNYFDGNRHTGHPAHDIFIYDRDQNALDDRTSRPVNVLSMTGGLVVAAQSDWAPTSDLRGGKYIWVYDPTRRMLVYYAHNGEICVRLGDVVKPGAVIAQVGRSGLNAAKKRSPTHLHFATFDLVDGRPTPRDCYRDLLKAKRTPFR